MTRWARITGGWAANLDGSDAAKGFTLPRVEVQATPQGFRSACYLPDGRRSEWTSAYPGGSAAAMADAVAHANRLLASGSGAAPAAPGADPGAGVPD